MRSSSGLPSRTTTAAAASWDVVINGGAQTVMFNCSMTDDAVMQRTGIQQHVKTGLENYFK